MEIFAKRRILPYDCAIYVVVILHYARCSQTVPVWIVTLLLINKLELRSGRNAELPSYFKSGNFIRNFKMEIASNKKKYFPVNMVSVIVQIGS